MNIRDRAASAMVGVALLGLVACGAERTSTLSSGAAGRRAADAPTTTTTPGLETTTTTTAPTTTTTTSTVPPTTSSVAGCDAPEVNDVPTPDAATTRQLIIGSWLLCKPPSVFGTTDEKGLVIAADGHWAKLASISAGSPVEMDGAENRGTWKLIDTSGMNGPGNFQINFNMLDGHEVDSPVRVIAPAKLLLNNEGLFIARYVPADVTVPPTQPVVPPIQGQPSFTG